MTNISDTKNHVALIMEGERKEERWNLVFNQWFLLSIKFSFLYTFIPS